MINAVPYWTVLHHFTSVIEDIMGSKNGLPPDRGQTIIWANIDVSSETWFKIRPFSAPKMHLNTPPAIEWPLCLFLNLKCLYCSHCHYTGSHLLFSRPTPAVGEANTQIHDYQSVVGKVHNQCLTYTFKAQLCNGTKGFYNIVCQ